jgi:hypothetical protein
MLAPAGTYLVLNNDKQIISAKRFGDVAPSMPIVKAHRGIHL